MGFVNKRNWGKGTLKYDPVKKRVWSQTKSGAIIKYVDMPTYGLEREAMPNDNLG